MAIAAETEHAPIINVDTKKILSGLMKIRIPEAAVKNAYIPVLTIVAGMNDETPSRIAS